ncbi:MAG: hypothetical protein EBS70_03105 [Actinobacteria bacterium]|nr:hypothetical protein [Actinomycetota bacterium]
MVIVGDGPCKAALKKLMPKAYFMGFAQGQALSEGVNGLFWDPQHPDTLIEKVHMLEAEGELRKVLAGNARGTVVDRTWSSIMEELEDHYRSVVDGARSMGVRGAA